MNVGRIFGEVAARSAGSSRVVLVACLVLALAAAVGALRLPVSSATDTLVDPGGEAYQATEQVRERFGEDPIVILAEGDLEELLAPPDLFRLINLEACLAGNVPEGAEPLPGPCQELAELKPAKLVTGPATFLNQAVTGITGELSQRVQQVERRAQRAARRAENRARDQGASPEQAEQIGQQAAAAVNQGFITEALGLAAQYGLSGIPSLTDPNFVATVVFDSSQPQGTPKARLAYLFPSAEAAQIIVRLRPDLSQAERARAVELIEAAAAEETPRARCAPGEDADPAPCFALESGSYTVSGAPVVLDALSTVLRTSLIVLLIAAVILMGLALSAVFRSRAPLLPLGLALAASAITFGGFGLFGGELTIAAIAVLPILIGLAVDYAIQLQARFDEMVESGLRGAEAARQAAAAGAPIVATACLATIAGFAILAFSPTPMVRGFGLILAVGVAISFLLALIVGSAALAERERRAGTRAVSEGPGDGGQGGGAATIRAAWRRHEVGKALSEARNSAGAGIGRFSTGVLAVAAAAPKRVLLTALLLACLGWAAGTRAETVSELTELAPQGLGEVRDLNRLQEVTGVSGELDVVVTAPDITDPEVISWMAGFKRRVLERAGYSGADPRCREAEICPGPSLTDFIAGAELGVSRERVRELIAALPGYELQGVVEIDPQTGELGGSANIAFMIRLMPLERQQELIEMIRAEAASDGAGGAPPQGVAVGVGGLPVIAAETADDLADSRYWLVLASLLAVAMMLLLLLRSAVRVGVAMVPIVLATGWSSLMLGAMQIPLNPVSAVLGVMVVAIGTEFSVILSSRYRQERQAGHGVEQALARTYSRSGAAVFASGVTVITGFAALIFSEVRMLRDFGIVTVVDLGVALAGVMLVLPAVLVLSERAGAARRARGRRRRPDRAEPA